MSWSCQCQYLVNVSIMWVSMSISHSTFSLFLETKYCNPGTAYNCDENGLSGSLYFTSLLVSVSAKSNLTPMTQNTHLIINRTTLSANKERTPKRTNTKYSTYKRQWKTEQSSTKYTTAENNKNKKRQRGRNKRPPWYSWICKTPDNETDFKFTHVFDHKANSRPCGPSVGACVRACVRVCVCVCVTYNHTHTQI